MALLAASGISKSYSARLLFDGVSFEIAPRDKVGLVGVNGCGKTTLFRILTGEEAPDTGSVMKHKGARMGFMRQNVENRSLSVFPRKYPMAAATYPLLFPISNPSTNGTSGRAA